MDLSQYAELFLAESREHLSACNQLLLEWERHPAASEPVGGIFRAVHTVKGMAATMGYGRVADLAHRMENLLDHLRRGGKPPTDDTLQLLFRATDALEKSVGLGCRSRTRAGHRRTPRRTRSSRCQREERTCCACCVCCGVCCAYRIRTSHHNHASSRGALKGW